MDGNDLMRLQAELATVSDELVAGSPDLAAARQVLAHDGEMKRNLLAKHVAPLLRSCSATAAETQARASTFYLMELESWMEQTETAQRVDARHRALYAKQESLRSLISLAKSQMNLV